MGMLNNLDDITEALEGEQLTQAEKDALLQEAKEKFDSLDVGFEFKKDTSIDKVQDLNQDFDTTRKILTNNVTRIEKLSIVLFDNIALDTTNINLIQTGISIVDLQNKNLKLLGELQAKTLLNKQALNKLIPPKKDDKKKHEEFKVK